MPNSSGIDQSSSYYNSQPRGFLTPPPSWKTTRRFPVVPRSEKKPGRSSPAKADLFHVIHKVPTGDSPYVRAKHVQLIDKDPSRAISLFWTAINSGDRVDSALKDMAIVMKQLDRSDEAIEAIKSFRHLCPFESQESLDNILVELYKQSGRIEEEIKMLQLKLKQVEEGIAFGGKRTKIARSQGKKIQITVEKEYSRLLGNLAWAYVQKKDFQSAEENYRKALSFESDKNKQCNLAICLMHLNKLTEAKFLLQAIRDSSVNGHMDESYAKSFERATQMLVELEKECVLKPMKWCEHHNKFVKKTNKGSFTEFPYEKRSDFKHRREYESPFCNARIPKVPFTQPRRSSSSFNYGDKIGGGFCRGKLSLEQSTNNENLQPVAVNKNLDYYSTASVEVVPKVSEKNLKSTHELQTVYKSSAYNCSKSWADMVEEDDQELVSTRSDFRLKSSPGSIDTEEYNDENVDCNIISENQAAKLVKKIESLDLGGGYFTQPEKKNLPMNPVKRSLCFDQSTENNPHASPLPMKALNFEGPGLVLSEDFTCTKSTKRGQRLQVFQDITCNSASPRA
ncbi:hypothetical protein CDL12_03176 [Handroanthus impetiginosus]|uniref:Uncharacterized protein n=1 Tax=Handroanthus impetiginosus TaxID=429701 RepID=A0A2G9I2V0_9LAMI|nr:hypothetical protein CDL12_03176 [Handroanthus impetiginosus]